MNAIIYQVEQSGLTTEDKQKVEAELRGLRAYYYYNLLDCFGNVPVVTDFTQKELPTNTPRKDVFARKYRFHLPEEVNMGEEEE